MVDDALNSGVAFPTTTLIDGHRALRTSICSARNTRVDVDRSFDAFANTGTQMDDEWRESASLPVFGVDTPGIPFRNGGKSIETFDLCNLAQYQNPISNTMRSSFS